MDNNVQWKDFYIKDIFYTFDGTNGIQTPTGSYIKKSELVDGDIPRITVRDTNNGIDSFCTSNSKDFRTYKNFISVSFLGSAFYHSYEASLDMKVHALIPKDFTLNEFIANFIIIAIRNNTVNSSYGNQLSSTDLPNLKIMLPVGKDNKINVGYMENYIKHLKKQHLSKYNVYLNETYGNIKNKKIPALNEKQWKDFYISDIFEEVQRGKRLKRANQISGDIPYISSTGINNGVDSFIGNTKNVRVFNNCLSLANSGSVGSCFYEPFEFVASDHVTHLKNQKFNKYIYLFLANQLGKLSEKYNFNREINDNRIKREKVVLPIDDSGKPDYEYMENYIKLKIKEQLQKYICSNI